MPSIPNIGSVMTPFVFRVDIDASIGHAEDLMTDHGVRHLVVMQDGELVGAVSDRDLAFASNGPDDSLRDRIRVREVCSLEPYVVDPEEPLDKVVSRMAEQHIGSVIVREGGKVTGIFTATDACRCLAALLAGSR